MAAAYINLCDYACLQAVRSLYISLFLSPSIMVELAKTVHEERQTSGDARGGRNVVYRTPLAPQHPEQRVGVFVDVQNLYYSAKNLYNSKVNFANVLRAAVGRRKLVRAIAYVIRADVKDEQNFFDALENIGFEVKAKDIQVFFRWYREWRWSAGLKFLMRG